MTAIAAGAGGAAFGAWRRGLDRTVLAAICALLGAGLLLSLAASPAAAARLGLADPFHFFVRHALFAASALGVALAVSGLSPQGARRVAVFALLAALAGLAFALAFGAGIADGPRALRLGPLSFQPAELFKPALVVAAAWLWTAAGLRGAAAAAGAAALGCALLLLLPAPGQAIVVLATMAGLALLAGATLRALGAAFGLCALGVWAAFVLAASAGVGAGEAGARARDAFASGGFFGAGPGEGAVKESLVDVQGDFVFAVAGEELGAVFCVALVALFAALTFGTLRRARSVRDPESRLAAAGLALLIGVQALVNLAASLELIAVAGVGLPFVSYGGSSLIAYGLAGGLILAFTRRPPAEVPSETAL